MSYLFQPSQTSASVENWSDSCPVCCMTNFKSNQEMVAHIEEHFNQKGHKFKLLSIINTHVIAWDAISHSAYDNIKHLFYNINKTLSV
jgi:hypothetical protein